MNPELIWSNGEITVWQFPLVVNQHELDHLASTLTAEEFGLAHGYGPPSVRRAAIVRRACLRTILAEMIGIAPREVVFEVGPHGKPVLADASIHFSSSSAHELGVVAVSRSSPVGVDIEHASRGEDIGGWTRKEAVLKASGLGVSALEEVPTIIPAKNVSILGFTAEVIEVDAPEGYSIALAWVVS